MPLLAPCFGSCLEGECYYFEYASELLPFSGGLVLNGFIQLVGEQLFSVVTFGEDVLDEGVTKAEKKLLQGKLFVIRLQVFNVIDTGIR